MTSLAYHKSYEFKIILYTTHSINTEKDCYNLIFHFLKASFCTHSVLSSYIFVTARKDSDQIVGDGIKNFTIHCPQVSQKKNENFIYFLLNISIAIVFAVKQL